MTATLIAVGGVIASVAVPLMLVSSLMGRIVGRHVHTPFCTAIKVIAYFRHDVPCGGARLRVRSELIRVIVCFSVGAAMCVVAVSLMDAPRPLAEHECAEEEDDQTFY